MFNSWIRRVAFWSLDALKGNRISKEYKDIKKIMALPYVEQKQIQNDYLKKIIEHAEKSTVYYSKFNSTDITDMPVVNKSIIKEHFEDFQSSKYVNEKKHSMSTSGSTGTPFTVYQDMRKRSRVLAELIYFNEIVGQKVGDKFCFFRVWTENDLKVSRNNKLALFAKNEIPIDISHLDDENMENIRQFLKKNKNINELMGYASTHKRLVQYIEKCGDSPSDFSIKLVVSGSEMLESGARKKLQEQFRCPVVSRYSNQENGVLGQQCKDSEKYHMNSASYYIELLKLDSDEPAEIGELGRIVVTDLFNYAMPMIRYDTGDLAIQTEKCICGWNTMILDNLQGRRVDVCVTPDGRLLSPLLLDKFMEPYVNLAQFQFIQEEENYYVLKINDPNNEYQDSCFEKMLRELLGNDAVFKIDRVDGIPCLDSGKYKQMICKVKKNK